MDIEAYLDDCENVTLDKDVVREALKLLTVKKMKFKDLVIAATAKVHGKTLITADRDFEGLEGVKVLFYKGG